LGWELHNSFEENEFKKDDRSGKLILELERDKIFCPNCGALNNFEIKHLEIAGRYECEGCKGDLGLIWEKFYKDEIKTIICDSCNEHTFRYFNYCIYCGNFIGKKIDKITQEVNVLDKFVGSFFGNRTYKIWIKFPKGAKISIITLSLLLICSLILLLFNTYFFYRDYLLIASLISGLVDFSLLITISAFYTEKVKKQLDKIKGEEIKERNLLPILIFVIILDAIIVGIVYLIIFLIDRLICSEC